MRRYLLGILCALWLVMAASAQSETIGTTIDRLNVRTTPQGTVITQLAIRTSVVIEARNRVGDWVLIHTSDNAIRGWVASRYLVWDEAVLLASFPISEEILSAPPPVTTTHSANNAPQPSVAVNSGEPLSATDEAIATRLASLPIVPTISANALSIYRRGVHELGRNPRYFLKIGDSNSASLAYLGLFGMGKYALGNYANLQPTIQYYLQAGNPFTYEPITARSGNMTTTIIDPIFTDKSYCIQGETPLACELRHSNASVALIYLGVADNQLLDVGTFYVALSQIVQECINNGVMPVLTTMPTRPHPERPQSYGLSFNNAILDIAAQFDIPVINMWLAVKELPEGGIQGDLLHFTISPSYPLIDFRNDLPKWGYTVWNLRVLQTLEAIRLATGG